MSKKIDLTDSSMWQSLDWDEKEVHPNLKRTDAQVNKARANRLKANNPEFGKKISEALTGRINGPHDKKTKKAIANSLLGKEKTEEHKKAMSDSHKGQIPINKGIPMSEKQKKQISEKRKGIATNPPGTILKKSICPHCSKEGGGGMMKRWHFDNCKHK